MSTQERIFCPGSLQVGSRSFKCHKHSGHGSVNHTEAMEQSCDVWFYQIGMRLGVDKIHEYATRFGLGEKTGIELGEEVSGLIPSTEWKKSAYHKPEDQKWYLGETPSVSIGQGAVNTTPIQIARGLSALVNGGKVFKPWLVRRLESSDGSLKDEGFGPEVVGEVGISPKVVKTVMDDLVQVVAGDKGTGKRASLMDEYGIQVAGKTGTAQVVGLEHGAGTKQLDDHAWFAAYAPAQAPTLVVVALVENGGHGGVTSAPLVKKVMEAYFFKYGTQGMPLSTVVSKN